MTYVNLPVRWDFVITIYSTIMNILNYNLHIYIYNANYNNIFHIPCKVTNINKNKRCYYNISANNT